MEEKQQYHVPGRAETSEQKRAIIDRLYAAWIMAPEQRLGQLLINTVTVHHVGLFQIEDEPLVGFVESLAADIKAMQ